MEFYHDNGNKLNADLYPLSGLCMSCKKKDDPTEEVFCTITRMDQLHDEEFKCFAYKKIQNND